jgi:hypothetical protein
MPLRHRGGRCRGVILQTPSGAVLASLIVNPGDAIIVIPTGRQTPLDGDDDGPQVSNHHCHTARTSTVLPGQRRKNRQAAAGRTVRRHSATAAIDGDPDRPPRRPRRDPPQGQGAHLPELSPRHGIGRKQPLHPHEQKRIRERQIRADFGADAGQVPEHRLDHQRLQQQQHRDRAGGAGGLPRAVAAVARSAGAEIRTFRPAGHRDQLPGSRISCGLATTPWDEVRSASSGG